MIDSRADLYGMFWEQPGKYNKICSARIIGSYHFLAALLNSAGSQLGYGTKALSQSLMTSAYVALRDGPASTILNVASYLYMFNTSGKYISLSPDWWQGPATPALSQSLAVSPITSSCYGLGSKR